MMLKITDRITDKITLDIALRADKKLFLTLSYEQRKKSRCRLRLDNGLEVGLFLPRGTILRDNDVLKSEDGQLIYLIAAKECVSTVYARSALMLLRAGYHLGNRHVALQIGDGWLRYQTDHVLDDMVRKLQLTLIHEEEIFEPEVGAYTPHQDISHKATEPVEKDISQDEIINFPALLSNKRTDASLLRLLQLASPTLPIGAFAYSQGLEYAVENERVTNEDTAYDWVSGLLKHSLSQLDIPVFMRLYTAWGLGDKEQVVVLNQFLFASRESSELQHEDNHLGQSLARLLADLGMDDAAPWNLQQDTTFACVFSLAAVRWDIALLDALYAYLWGLCENQIIAVMKLVPLGQTAGQRILSKLIQDISFAVERGASISDENIGFSSPGLGIVSALHETQYTRLFRS